MIDITIDGNTGTVVHQRDQAANENLLPAIFERGIEDANQYHTTAVENMACAADSMILCGLALLELRAEAPHGSWESLFEGSENRVSNGTRMSHFNFGYKTAQRYMALGQQAKHHIKELKDVQELDIPFSHWTEGARQRIASAIRSKIKASSYSELARDWGIARPLPPKQKPESKKRDGTNPDGAACARMAREDIAAVVLKMDLMRDEKTYWMAFADLEDLGRLQTALDDFQSWLSTSIHARKKQAAIR